MPAGSEVTDPDPFTGTPSVWVIGVNVAVTVWSAVMVTEQGPVPVQAPVQPVNAKPVAGVGVSATTVPSANVVLHVVGQVMPAGFEATDPDPFTVTPSVWVIGVNVA